MKLILALLLLSSCSTVHSSGLQREIEMCSIACAKGGMTEYQACKCKGGGK